MLKRGDLQSHSDVFFVKPNKIYIKKIINMVFYLSIVFLSPETKLKKKNVDDLCTALGLVVQSMVSLTSSFRDQLIKYFMTL